MADAVKTIKGVTPDLEAKLKEQGISNSDQLLEAGATPAHRRELAGKLGVDQKALLELLNRADLARVKGIGGVFADLLENAGVDTVKELAGRVPANLHAKLVQVNAEHKLAHHVPTEEQVVDWVKQAKELPKLLQY
jgi:predicted flap endonuclease-1-like 5' DNA nuclease